MSQVQRTLSQKVTGMATQDGAGVSLTRLIGQPALRRLDPFLMLDFFGSDKADDYIAGFPAHPHRGFQTVTYMLQGKMRHRDSVGNEGIIEDGGIQWMNAGKGLIHEEMPQQTEGVLKGFQLWVNLPASQKMSEPGYQDIQPDAVPWVELGAQCSAKVLAGTLNDTQGPVHTESVAPLFIDVHFQDKDRVSLPIDEGHNGFVYCYEGEVTIGQEQLITGQLGVMGKGDTLTLEAHSSAKLIVVAGKPINEPIAQYGPFVMNTEAEIQQALADYQAGVLA